jgi:DNA-binding XRE family transcriptional regulator
MKSEIKRKDFPSASELTLYQAPFRYRLRIEGNITKRLRRVILVTALKKLHELFREPKEATIYHQDSSLLNNYRTEFRETSLREAHTLKTAEEKSGFSLKIRRHSAKLTLRQLAHKANVNSAHLCQIEKGKVKPRPSTLKKIEQALLECKAS